MLLSFSFTAKELRADPWSTLQGQLEQLDIKYSSEYEHGKTSHVVTKKRNTPKGLLALIFGKHVVTETFINAIVGAAAVSEQVPAGTPSLLESDFDSHWPNPLDYLPPRGEEPSDRPVEAYAPDPRREDVFEGYTFIFYEKKQYENLFPVITSGKGKALFEEVVPGTTQVDDFIRYVKGVAGEKGLGSFDDGSEGRGVVVVRYTPGPKGADVEWFLGFLNSVAQRLDHRPIDQRDFLEAILSCDASMLRRPLLEEDTQAAPASREPAAGVMEVDAPVTLENAPARPADSESLQPSRRHTRPKNATGSRFRGFALDSDDDDEPIVEIAAPAPTHGSNNHAEPADADAHDSLFVSQNPVYSDEIHMDDDIQDPPHPQRKRPFHDVSAFLDEIAPTAAAVKRRRVAAGEDPVPGNPPSSAPEMDEDDDHPPRADTRDEKGGKKRSTLDSEQILELARQRRQETELRAAEERKALTELPEDGVDYAAIRRLQIIEDCEVHYPVAATTARTRDQEVADGRWDPRWNGRKNFKKFRKHGDPAGRPPPRIIISLEEAKPKGYGIGDDYWLEGESVHKETQSQPESQSLRRDQTQASSATKPSEKEAPRPKKSPFSLDSSDDEQTSLVEDTLEEPQRPAEISRTRAGKAAEKANSLRSQIQEPSQSQARANASKAGDKRAAATTASPAKEKAPKRQKRFVAASDSDDSDDELRFKFGRRR